VEVTDRLNKQKLELEVDKTWFALVKKNIYNMLNTKIKNEQYYIGFEGEI
jgi:predicted component of type VI protein secretion system